LSHGWAAPSQTGPRRCSAFWLVKGYGLPGAAWAWSIRVALDAILLHAASAAALGQPAASYRTLARTAAGPLMLCSAGFALVRALGYPLTNPVSLSAVAGVAVLYALLLWHTVLEDRSKQSILAALRPSPRCRPGPAAESAAAPPTPRLGACDADR
jgi:hypothetical protein